MADSVKVTPASRKIEFFNPTTAAAKSTISLDTSGNLTIVADGTIDIGDTSADIYVGDGSSNVDIVYTADGEIRTEGSGVELSIVSDENIKFPGSGNVGIGVANPYAKLSVDTNFLVSVPADTADPKVEGILQRITGNTNDNPSMEIFFVENHNLNYGFRMHFDGSNNRMRFYTHSNSTSGSEVMRFNRDAGSDIWLGLASNNVMIGSTTAPAFPLHLKYTDNRTDPQGSGNATGAGAIGVDAEGGGLYIENASTTDGSWAGITFRTDTADARIAYQSVGSSLVNEGQMSFFLDTNDAPNQYVLEEVLRLRGGSSDSDSNLAYNLAYVNGRLGVGTATPDDLIEIMNGGLKITREETEDSAVVEDSVGLSVAAGLKWTFSKAFDDPNPVPIGTTTDNDVRIIRNNGTHTYWYWDRTYFAKKVGIGTNGPSTRLHVAQSGTNHLTALTLDNGLDTNGGKSVGMDLRVRYGDSNIASSYIGFDYYGDKLTSNSHGMIYRSGRAGFAHHHFVADDNTRQLMIADDGDVGIGPAFTHAAQPGAKLHLKGSGGGEKLLIEDTGTDSNPALEIKNDAAHWKIQNRGGDSNKLRIVEDTSTLMVIQTNGNVGINDTTPSYKLDVSGTARVTSNLIGNTRISCDRGTGSTEMSSTDGVFEINTQVDTGSGNSLATPTYSNVSQNLSAITTQGNCVRTSRSGTNTSFQVPSNTATKLYLFAIVLHGDGSVLDHFQSFDVTVYCSVDDSANRKYVHRKTIHGLYEGSQTNIIYSYSNEMENFTNNAFDVGVEYSTGDSTVAGVASGNINLALVYITFPPWGGISGHGVNDKVLTDKLDWSWEFTGLKDEAHVG